MQNLRVDENTSAANSFLSRKLSREKEGDCQPLLVKDAPEKGERSPRAWVFCTPCIAHMTRGKSHGNSVSDNKNKTTIECCH
ncbi:jg17730 [Pararge aegeria aegeria]|uniref:Jg17730 protein n=1 Tax=Pararge aegeria aegeria TaxID=348720 RepID=A0A8S4S7R0_9NEOP|nr:jg17730 [Pararge aegeria aegeria]